MDWGSWHTVPKGRQACNPNTVSSRSGVQVSQSRGQHILYCAPKGILACRIET